MVSDELFNTLSAIVAETIDRVNNLTLRVQALEQAWRDLKEVEARELKAGK